MLLREVEFAGEDAVDAGLNSTSLLVTQPRGARVLVVCIDDGLFALHVDWVEAVYPRAAVHVHTIRTRAGQAQRFLAHAASPALIVDLREVFDLQAALAVPQRAQYLVLRSGSLTLAVAVDACVGVRELDLHTQIPVASTVLRDGGFPVAHIVSLDGKMLAVLDPNHLLDGALRIQLSAMQHRAERFLTRQAQLDAVWDEICAQPSAATLRTFARLCARTGRGRAAAATRLVLKHLSGPNGDGEPTSEPERLIGTVLRLSLERRTGELVLAPNGAANGHKLVFVDGRIINAWAGDASGTAACAQLLAARIPDYHFIDTDPTAGAAHIHESTVALAIASLEGAGAARRPRLS
jgi:hypothetical protein